MSIIKIVSDGYNQLALDLYKQINHETENLFISPNNVGLTLTLCYAGAKNETAKQLAHILNYNNLETSQVHTSHSILLEYIQNLKDGLEFNIANRIYPKYDTKLRKDFVRILQTFYNSDVECLNYSNANECVRRINEWVKLQTNNQIMEFTHENNINEEASLVCVNVAYLKAKWTKSFIKEATYEKNFYLSDGSIQKVDMMVLIDKRFNYIQNIENLNVSICELEFANRDLSMTIILPHEDNDIETVISKLDKKSLRDILENNNEQVRVDVYIPKFKIEEDYELAKKVFNIGVEDAFLPNTADLSGINDDNEQLHISSIMHKAVIEVAEEGVEEASIANRETEHSPLPDMFICDKPFLFLIHENQHKTILFIGKYENPRFCNFYKN